MKNTFFAVALAAAALGLHSPAHAAGSAADSVPTATHDLPSSGTDSTPTTRSAESAEGHSVLTQMGPAPASRLSHFDVEVDPFAYIAQGHSLHLGFRFSRLRFDLGSFSMIVPEFVHGQPGFENQGRGYGVKLDGYLLEPGSGPFIGAEGAWFAQEIIDLSTEERVEVSSWLASGRVGWEFEVGAGFYVRPWVGVGYRFGNDTVELPNGTFEQTPIMIFPTVHVGYVFP